MTDSEFMLQLLSDGREHSTMEIIAASINQRGCGITPHSRASDLRRRGHHIDCEFAGKARGRPIWTYRLVGSLPTSPQSLAVLENDHETHDGKRNPAEGRGDVESEQALFTYPRSPEWA